MGKLKLLDPIVWFVHLLNHVKVTKGFALGQGHTAADQPGSQEVSKLSRKEFLLSYNTRRND